MKRRILIFSILAVFGVLAFGANAAFAQIDFDSQTGEMIYTTEGIKYDQGDDVSYATPRASASRAGSRSFPVTMRTDSLADAQHGEVPLQRGLSSGVSGDEGQGDHRKGDDVITVQSNVTQSTTLIGGGGSDTITGGGGNDTIYGACGAAKLCYGYSDNLSGGNGNDTLHGGDTTPVFGLAADILHGGNGDDTLDGGLGPDQLYGELGNDTGDYSARTEPIVASLNDLGDDGSITGFGEHDNIHNDIEIIVGGSNNDTLVGNGVANKLYGGAGDDTPAASSARRLQRGWGATPSPTTSARIP
jgi:Ca2+-binding RTX toxin-like protein